MNKMTITALSLLIAQCTLAENWPEFRGPTAQGISTSKNLPTEWTTEKNVKWKIPSPGAGWSSPIYVDGILYLTAAAEKNGGKQLNVIAIDAKTGKINWQKTIFEQTANSPKIHKKNSHASPTPIYEDGQLYVHFGHAGTARLDLNGNIIWKRIITYEPMHGNGGSPALTGKALIFSCDGKSDPFVIALSRDTGEPLWQTPRNLTAKRRFSFCTPLLIEVKGRQQVILPGSGGVVAYDPTTGKEIWWLRYGEGYSVVPRPVYTQGLLIVCSGFDTAQTWAVRPDGAGDVTDTHLAWRFRKGSPLTPSPLVVGEDLYLCADRGILSCINPKNGEAYWSERINGAYSASPVLANGLIYCQSEEGETVVIRPNREKLDVVARNDLEERSLASFAIADNAIFIRTDDHLYCIQK